MSNYNYGGPNPYDARGANDGGYGGAYNHGGGGSGDGYGGAGYAQDGGSNVEMSSGGHIAVLNECRNIDDEIRKLENMHQQLRILHDKAAYEAGNEPDSRTNQEITALIDDIRDKYRALGDRMKNLATKPESQSPKSKPQVERVKRALKDSVQQFATLQSQLSREKDADIERQYRIVNSNAPETEVRRYMDGVRSGQEDPNQLFQQALMQSSRIEGANRKLSALRARNQALLGIERQMAELLELFTQLDTIVMQQDVAVAEIEQKAEEIVGDLNKGNDEIGTAVKTARATRRKKWWCIGIVVAIIIVVVVVILIWLGVNGRLGGGGGDNSNQNPNPPPAKRDVFMAHVRGGPARLLSDRFRPISRIIGRNFVDTSFAGQDSIRSVFAADV